MYSSLYCLLKTWLTEPGVITKNPKCKEEPYPEPTKSIYFILSLYCSATKDSIDDVVREEFQEERFDCKHRYYAILMHSTCSICIQELYIPSFHLTNL